MIERYKAYYSCQRVRRAIIEIKTKFRGNTEEKAINSD